MDIAELKADHKTRAEAVAKRLNEVLDLERRIQAEKQDLINESLRLNGEARMLKNLADNGDKPKEQDPTQPPE